MLTLGISRNENEWLWIGGFLIALAIYLFYASQKQLREKSWLMLEAIRNRDYSFRLPTHGFIGGERILQNALNGVRCHDGRAETIDGTTGTVL